MLKSGLILAFMVALANVSPEAQSQSKAARAAQELAQKEKHVGPVEDAIVGIEALDPPQSFAANGKSIVGAGPRPRVGNGLIIRCDGFILAPSSLFQQPRSERLNRTRFNSVRVTFNPGTELERIAVAELPVLIQKDLGYAVLKVSDIHIPAGRTQLDATLKQGDQLRLAWSPWNSAKQKFEQVTHVDLNIVDSTASEGLTDSITLNAGAQALPAGCIAVNSGGLAVGLGRKAVSGKGPLDVEALAHFERASNCISPAPPVDNKHKPAAGAGQSAFVPADSMIKVPGGPFTLPWAARTAFLDMAESDWACVGPFEIDKYEVTNKEYLAFLRAISTELQNDKKRAQMLYPAAWALASDPFPSDQANLPVIGVTYEGAEAYAKWRGKRLPTPYEWCFAALGKDGDAVLPEWAQRYADERTRAWLALYEEHKSKTFETLERQQEARVIPWFFVNGGREAAQAVAWSKNRFLTAFASLDGKWNSSQEVIGVGSRKFDTSAAGLVDATLNASELIIPWPDKRSTKTPTVYAQMNWLHSDLFGGVKWTMVKPQGQWWNFLHETASFPPTAPLLSRYLYHTGGTGRNPAPDYVRYVAVASALFQIADMIRPIDSWRLTFVNGPAQTFTFPYGFINGSWGGTHPPLIQTAAYPVWSGLPPWFKLEMGRPVPFSNETLGPNNLPVPIETPGNVGIDYWLVPGGFRCAR